MDAAQADPLKVYIGGLHIGITQEEVRQGIQVQNLPMPDNIWVIKEVSFVSEILDYVCVIPWKPFRLIFLVSAHLRFWISKFFG